MSMWAQVVVGSDQFAPAPTATPKRRRWLLVVLLVLLVVVAVVALFDRGIV